jgi:RND family efflux transporter MFP subunit
LAVAADAFRSRLADAPIIGNWFADGSVEAGDIASATYSASPVAGAPTAMDRRVEVSIDPKRQQLIGVRTAAVERSEATPTVRAVGLVRYDETRLADVNLKVEGWIRELYVDYTGRLVTKGQPLFALYSPELLTTQNEYLLALKTRDQVRESQIPDAREFADRLVESARQRLTLWDLPADQLQALDDTRQPRATMIFRSPVSGYVIEKQALQGAHVMAGQTLYKIADLSSVWVEADVYEREMPLIGVGRPATVTLEAYPGVLFRGRAIYIYPFVEERTRTARVRFELPNPGGRLKPGMYANVELQAPSRMSLTIPSNAVLEAGKQQIVFIALGDGYFEPRAVKVGTRLGERVEILEGLKEGEQVATGATFFLDSESQLRAALRSYEGAPAPTGSGSPAGRLDVTFRSTPDPPRTGDNAFEVTVKDPAGQPVDDADVSVIFFMPAMPTMNMPAMRNETKLASAGGGIYRGAGQVLIAGRWDVTVTVTRKGERLGSKQLAVSAQ